MDDRQDPSASVRSRLEALRTRREGQRVNFESERCVCAITCVCASVSVWGSVSAWASMSVVVWLCVCVCVVVVEA
jgi:Flp pilus assembly protein TadB